MLVDRQSSHLRSLLVAGLIASASGVMSARPAHPALSPLAAQASSPRVQSAETRARIVQSYGRLPLRFEANQGQADKRVGFLARGSNYALYLTGQDAVLALHKKVTSTQSRTDVVQMQLAGANAESQPMGINRLPGTSNYLMGSDPAQWHTGVPTYSSVRYSDVYPGIDLVYYGNQRKLEYDFVVAPHADPNLIRLHFAGAKTVILDENGNLHIVTEDGDIAFEKPVVYQRGKDLGNRRANRQEVPGQFALLGDNSVGFNLGQYDNSRQLVIDPTLVYSTFLGGSAEDQMSAIAVDSNGAAYLTGSTESSDYPVTPGVFKTTDSDAQSICFVTKLNASGTALIYSSYLGGSGGPSGGDAGLDIAVDSNGDAFIVGSTYSNNFPTTTGAYQTTNKAFAGNGSTGFVTKVNPTGTALIYSTYLGGTLTDNATSLAIDSAGDAYVAGFAFSTNFPTTTGAYQTTNKSAGVDGWNEFLTKLNPTGTGLIYSTYIGGSNEYSSPTDIQVAIDSSGDAYLAGIALSTDFPTTKGAYQATNKAASGHSDITLTKFNPTGTALVYSTYFGGSGSAYGDDVPNGLAVDSSGNVYFSGSTWEADFPVTSGAFQKTSEAVANDLSSAFVTKMNPAGSALVYSTYLGGSGNDRGYRLAVDSSGDVYVAGSAGSSDFPVTSNAYQTTNLAAFNDGSVVFLTEFNPAGSGLIYSTYMGGSNSFGDTAYGIELGSSGAVYLAGIATGSNFPTTPGAYKTNYSSLEFTTGFVAEFNLGSALPGIATTTTLTPSANPGITGSNLTFTASVVAATGTGIPTGKVVFSIDEVNTATVALNSKGWAAYTTTTPLALGQHAILATYQGSSTYATSGGNITESIVPDTPTITPAGGIYPAAQLVTIKDGTTSTVIYYTTDGVAPSASSTKYTGPISVSVPETIRAIAILPSGSSSVAAASYTLIAAPSVLAVPATAISTPNANLNALVNTFGMTGSYYFEYGTTSTALTSATAKTALPESALGSRIGVTPVLLSTRITGLTTKTTYYYKVVIITPAGTSSGAVLSFTTN
jgi:Chitobiase/beta-hexosaminidase C-terminal domain/Beta-propeller repeat